jgi:hypothetical protein
MIEILVYSLIYFFLACFFLAIMKVKDANWAFFYGAITSVIASAIVKFI